MPKGKEKDTSTAAFFLAALSDPDAPSVLVEQAYAYASSRNVLSVLEALCRRRVMPEPIEAALAEHPAARVRSAWTARTGGTPEGVLAELKCEKSTAVLAVHAARTDLPEAAYDLLAGVNSDKVRVALLTNQACPLPARRIAARRYGASMSSRWAAARGRGRPPYFHASRQKEIPVLDRHPDLLVDVLADASGIDMVKLLPMLAQTTVAAWNMAGAMLVHELTATLTAWRAERAKEPKPTPEGYDARSIIGTAHLWAAMPGIAPDPHREQVVALVNEAIDLWPGWRNPPAQTYNVPVRITYPRPGAPVAATAVPMNSYVSYPTLVSGTVAGRDVATVETDPAALAELARTAGAARNWPVVLTLLVNEHLPEAEQRYLAKQLTWDKRRSLLASHGSSSRLAALLLGTAADSFSVEECDKLLGATEDPVATLEAAMDVCVGTGGQWPGKLFWSMWMTSASAAKIPVLTLASDALPVLVRHAVNEMLRERLGTSQARWDLFAALLADFTGTLEEVLTTVEGVFAGVEDFDTGTGPGLGPGVVPVQEGLAEPAGSELSTTRLAPAQDRALDRPDDTAQCTARADTAQLALL